MEINNTNDYLKYRATILNNERSEKIKKLESNQTLINELNHKITEIKSAVDEGFEMFSPRAAEDKSFNRQEVKELQMRMILIVDENKELSESIKRLEEELRIINHLILLEDNRKKKVQEEQKKKRKAITQSLLEKVDFCCNIVESDPRRVKIELQQILEEEKKG